MTVFIKMLVLFLLHNLFSFIKFKFTLLSNIISNTPESKYKYILRLLALVFLSEVFVPSCIA